MRDQGTTYSYNNLPCPWHRLANFTLMSKKRLSSLLDDTRWPMLWDDPEGFAINAIDPPSDALPHSGGLNVAYGDGHARYYRMGTHGPEAEYYFEHSGDGLYPGQ
jgi:prepilin-type processing-associated H-X9-DG protein